MLKAFAGRASLIGDSIMSLPILAYIKALAPDCYTIFPISKKTSHSAPFFLNHPFIDKIYIMEGSESLVGRDLQVLNECKIKINPFPNHPEGNPSVTSFWWNDYNCCEETFRMAGLPVEDYRLMPEHLRKPRLEKWFNIDTIEKTITIWPFAGYGGNNPRNPSLKWWSEMLVKISEKFDFNIIHLGHFSEPYLGLGVKKYTKMTHLPLFDQVKMALGCGVSIGTDSGSGWIMGAYGHKQITLMALHEPSHYKNFLALAPENYLNNNTVILTTSKSCDSINQLDVLNQLERLC